jgi:hypothetical protein
MGLLSPVALIHCILGTEDIAAVEETTFGLSFNAAGLLLIGPTSVLPCGLVHGTLVLEPSLNHSDQV